MMSVPNMDLVGSDSKIFFPKVPEFFSLIDDS